jgi:hypothetical protein
MADLSQRRQGKAIGSQSTVEASVLVGDTLETAIARDFACIPEIRHVMTDQVNGLLRVWISIDDPAPEEVRMQVHQKELDLIDDFPAVDFDFNLIPAMGREPEEIATGEHVVYSR